MGRVINLELNLQTLLVFAEKALDDGDTLTCALNLNEAMQYASTREEKRAVYAVYIKCFNLTSNIRSVMDVVAKDVTESVEEDYFRMDFDLKRRAFFEDEEEPPTYEQVKAFSRVKNLIFERRYDEAMELLTKTEMNYGCMEDVVEVLINAIDCDTKLNLDKYIMPLIGIMAGAPNRIDMLRLLLDGGKHTHNIMVDSADYLLDEEDSNALCLMGMAYYESNEPETAEKFFLKALELDPIDEDALYYMYAIGKHLDIKENEKYWDRYKEVYGITDPPVNLIEEFLDSDERDYLVPYLTLPLAFAKKKAEALSQIAAYGDVDEEFKREFSDFASLAPEHLIFSVMKKIGDLSHKPNAQLLYVKLLASGRVSGAIKERMLNALVDSGYEGDLCILLEKRVIFTRFAKLHRRVEKGWQLIYNLILRTLPFVDAYVPIRCSVLSAVIKKLDTVVNLDEDDIPFAFALAVVNYLNKLRININMWEILRAINIDGMAVDRGMAKHGLASILI